MSSHAKPYLSSQTILSRIKAFQSPDRYVFKDPDTGYMHYGIDRADIIKRIVSYRAQNELPPIEALNAVLDNYLCGLPENAGKCEPNILHRSFIAYIKGGIALLQNLYYGKENIVEQNVADLRALQCRGCEFNVFPDKDLFIQFTDELAVKSTGGLKSQYYDDLGNCDACSCPLRAKVWFKGPFDYTKEEEEKFRKVNCWQLKKDKPKSLKG